MTSVEKVGAVGKAALKRPHSKRSASNKAHDAARQRLECGRFSAAFGGRADYGNQQVSENRPLLPRDNLRTCCIVHSNVLRAFRKHLLAGDALDFSRD